MHPPSPSRGPSLTEPCQVAALITEVTKKVQENEPNTLLYYAFQVQGKKEIAIVERSAPIPFSSSCLVPRHFRISNGTSQQTGRAGTKG